MIVNFLSFVTIAWFLYDMLYSFCTVTDLTMMLTIIVVDILSETVILHNLGKIKLDVRIISVALLIWYSFYLPIDIVSNDGWWTYLYCFIDLMMIFQAAININGMIKIKEQSYTTIYKQNNYRDYLWKIIFIKN